MSDETDIKVGDFVRLKDEVYEALKNQWCINSIFVDKQGVVESVSGDSLIITMLMGSMLAYKDQVIVDNSLNLHYIKSKNNQTANKIDEVSPGKKAFWSDSVRKIVEKYADSDIR
jgi:hypothetical protein